MDSLFYEIFEGLPRLGPGSDTATQKALQLIHFMDNPLTILDIGCGTGAQTFQLAKKLNGKIIAVDNYQPYLDEIQSKCSAEKYKAEIEYLCLDMTDLKFKEESIDLVWAEGSIYIMGFQKGLDLIEPMIKKGGYAVFSELNYLKNDPPDELMNFFHEEFPDMLTIGENIDLVKKSSLDLVNYFELDKIDHRTPYYEPLQQNVTRYTQKYLENDEARLMINSIQKEIDLYIKYADYYGYVFYVMQKLY
jgi:ubiquinone/menaquinone biosynthesis C-methylase UbiE